MKCSQKDGDFKSPSFFYTEINKKKIKRKIHKTVYLSSHKSNHKSPFIFINNHPLSYLFQNTNYQYHIYTIKIISIQNHSFFDHTTFTSCYFTGFFLYSGPPANIINNLYNTK
jgi:hypothetical protein